MTGEVVAVSIAFGTREAALRVGKGLVEARLAACGQVHPVQSVYRWRNAVEEADEHMLVVKTTAEMIEAVAAFVSARHSYEVPEIIAQPVTWVSPAYAEWVRSSVGQSDGSTARS